MIQGEIKGSGNVPYKSTAGAQAKKKSSRNNQHAENKENIDIEELEAETARIHREMLSGVGEKTNIDS